LQNSIGELNILAVLFGGGTTELHRPLVSGYDTIATGGLTFVNSLEEPEAAVVGRARAVSMRLFGAPVTAINSHGRAEPRLESRAVRWSGPISCSHVRTHTRRDGRQPGRRPASRFRLGRVAEALALTAPEPVLLVPERLRE
jgi:nucleotide-binding universal stress UspA family protein